MASSLSGYHLRHLVAHLLDRRRVDDACRMLLATSPDGENVLFAARDRVGDLPGLLDDVVATLNQLASSQAVRFDRELELSLVRATVQTIASREPVVLIRARMQTGFWRREDALRFADAQADLTRRAAALIAIAQADPDGDNFAILRQALTALEQAAGSTGQEWYRPLFELMPDEGRTEVLAQITRAASHLTLLDVLPIVPERDVEAAIAAGLESARSLTAESARGRSIVGSAQMSEGETGSHEELVEASRAESVARLSVRAGLREALFAEALEAAERTTGRLRLQTLARLCRSAPPAARDRLLPRLLDDAMQSTRGLRILVRELAGDLDDSARALVLARVHAAEPQERIVELVRLAPFLSADTQSDAVTQALADLGDSWNDAEKPVFAARALGRSVGRLMTPAQREAFLALVDSDVEHRSDLLLALVEGTLGKSEDVVARALRDVTQTPRRFDELAWIFHLQDLMGSEGLHFFDDQLVQAADPIRKNSAALLAMVDPSLQSSVLPAAARAVRRIGDGSATVLALAAIAAVLDEGPDRITATEAAFAAADRLEGDGAQLLATASLIRIADGSTRSRLTERLTEHLVIGSSPDAEIFARAVPFVDDTVRHDWARRAADHVQQISADQTQWLGRSAGEWLLLAAGLPEKERLHVEEVLLGLIRADEAEQKQEEVEALASMLPYLSAPRRPDLAGAVYKRRAILRGPNRGLVLLDVLDALAPGGTEAFPVRAFSVVAKAGREAADNKCPMCRDCMVGCVFIHVDELPFDEMVAAAMRIPLDWILYRALRRLVARRIAVLSPEEALAGWRVLLNQAGVVTRSRFLLAVSEMIPVLQRAAPPGGLADATRAIVRVTQCWP